MEYSEAVRRYFEHTQSAGVIEGGRGLCVSGSAGRERQGLRIWLAARIVEDRIAEACFRAYGCPHTIAMAAWTAEQLAGKAVSELESDPLGAAARLGLPAEKLKCALCAEDAVLDLRSNWLAIAQSESFQLTED